MIRNLYILPAVLVLATNCRQPRGTGTQYFPARVGTQWNCRFWQEFCDDTAFFSGTVNSTYSVGKAVEFAGTFRPISELEYIVSFYLTATDDTLFMTAVDGEGGTLVSRFALFPKPLEDKVIGTEWVALSGNPPCRARVIGRSTVTTPAGTYHDCVSVEYRNVPRTEATPVVVWFAPGIGPVKVHAVEDYQDKYWELISYTSSGRLRQ